MYKTAWNYLFLVGHVVQIHVASCQVGSSANDHLYNTP